MKVSVIIPVYNVEAYVGDALRSVLDQTLQDFEIICVNDGSADGSWEVVKGFSRSDTRIRLYENPSNMGAAAARNAGLEQAKGEYVYFLDADDRIVPDALEKLYKKARENCLDFIVFCARFVYEDRCYEERFSANPSVFKGTYPDVLSGRELFLLWMKYWDWMPVPPRFIYRRQFLEEHFLRFPTGLLHEDEIFTLDALMQAARVHVLKEALYLRRFRGNSSMTGKITIRNVEACLWILQHAAAHPAIRSDAALKEAASFYRKKITEETRRKYAAAGFEGEFLPCGKSPFLSVIIPVYTVEAYLPDCLDSVLSQDFIDFELICVDDASSDGSLEILRSFEKMDPRIRILTHEKNLGQGAARNRGLDCARGKYIYMMDADDLIAEGTFRTLYKECVRFGADIICFENSQFTDDPSLIETAQNILFSYEGTEGIYNGRDAFVTLVRRDILSPSVPTYLISGDFIRQYHLRFEEGLPHEDIGFIFEMLIHAGRVQLMHRPLYLRRFRAQSTVTDTFGPKRACGYLCSWKKAFENRDCILQEHREDQEYLAAWRKWSRDVLGRIRMLYLNSGPENSHAKECLPETGTNGMTEELLLEMLRETTTVPGRARYILGEETAEQLELMGEVYICGPGQYMNRMLDVVGALDVVIKGIIITREDRKKCRAIRGFRVFTPEEIPDQQTPVILAVSHYNEERYGALLREAGLEQILHVCF